jgi:hypothetical protein
MSTGQSALVPANFITLPQFSVSPREVDRARGPLMLRRVGFAERNLWNIQPDWIRPHSALMLAARITLPPLLGLFRHVPLAARRKCYIRFASRRKGASPSFLLHCVSPVMAHRVDSLRCEGSDAIGAKRTCREGRSDEDDPLPKSGRPKCCDAQHGFFNDVVGCYPGLRENT